MFIERQLCDNLTAPTCDNRSDDVLSADALILLKKLVVDAILRDDPVVPLYTLEVEAPDCSYHCIEDWIRDLVNKPTVSETRVRWCVRQTVRRTRGHCDGRDDGQQTHQRTVRRTARACVNTI